MKNRRAVAVGGFLIAASAVAALRHGRDAHHRPYANCTKQNLRDTGTRWGRLSSAALGLLVLLHLGAQHAAALRERSQSEFCLLSPIIIVFFAAFFFLVIRRSGLPATFFGFYIDNLRAALPFAAVASLAFLAAIVFLKWILILTVPQLHGVQLVGFADIRIGNQDGADTPWYWVALLAISPAHPGSGICGALRYSSAALCIPAGKRAETAPVLSIVVSQVSSSQPVHAHVGLVFARPRLRSWADLGLDFPAHQFLACRLRCSHLFVGGARHLPVSSESKDSSRGLLEEETGTCRRHAS